MIWLLQVAGVVGAAVADVRTVAGIDNDRLLLDVVAFCAQFSEDLVELGSGDCLNQLRTVDDTQLGAQPLVQDSLLGGDDEDARAVGGARSEETRSALLEGTCKIELQLGLSAFSRLGHDPCFGFSRGFGLGLLGFSNGWCRARDSHDGSFLLKK